MAAPRGGAPAGAAGAPDAGGLVRFAARGPLRLPLPGHQGGTAAPPAARGLLGADPLAFDVPLLTAGVDVAEDDGLARYDADLPRCAAVQDADLARRAVAQDAALGRCAAAQDTDLDRYAAAQD